MELTEGIKYDSDKVRLDLWSPYAIQETGVVLTFGAEKYVAYNWARGLLYSRVYAALLRHLLAWWNGEELDSETGRPHLAHAMCCLMFLLHYETSPFDYSDFDDRPDFANGSFQS